VDPKRLWLTLASLILLGGSLGDRYGRRRIFVFGTGVFTTASLPCAVAPNAQALVAARLVQGVGGALLTPGSLAMVESGFRSVDRPRAIGAWSGLGGWRARWARWSAACWVAAVSWRAVVVINLPLGIFIVVVADHRERSRN
jgi:MFS family permease